MARLRSGKGATKEGEEAEVEAASTSSSGGRLSYSTLLRKWKEEWEPLYWYMLPLGLLLMDLLLSIVVILKVNYTEIDWVAYMQEVAGYLEHGETDYLKLRGDTGPLVYPGGFVWIFSALYYLTNKGTDLRLAQWIFMVVYLFNLAILLRIYQQTKMIPPYAFPLLILSKRVHSIFMLRMFNDAIAMCFLYLAVLCFINRKWAVGCISYSLGVSVKMNIFLFAPGLALILLQALGWYGAFTYILLCGIVQLVVAYPFLYTHPVSYLTKAFELSRVFEYKWTVNWRFLPVEAFLDKKLAIGLLLGMLLSLVLFAHKWLKEEPLPKLLGDRDSSKQEKEGEDMRIRTRRRKKDGDNEEEEKGEKRGTITASTSKDKGNNLTGPYIITTLFLSNFIGIVFARTLHYQFYSWYFHTLPGLLWSASILPWPIKLLLMGGIEYAFNVFPSTNQSSLILQVCHIVLLVALYLSPMPAIREKEKKLKAL